MAQMKGQAVLKYSRCCAGYTYKNEFFVRVITPTDGKVCCTGRVLYAGRYANSLFMLSHTQKTHFQLTVNASCIVYTRIAQLNTLVVK